MNAGDYFDWMSRHTRRRRALEDDDPPDREEPAAPSEPIQVHEFDGASTTIIERIRGALLKRLRGD